MARALAFLIPILVLALVAGCGRARADGDAAPDRAVVVEVVDGDTLDVRLASGRRERVRLVGIDTPESVDPNRPVECHGPEASALLAQLLPAGIEIRLERDTEARDRFGRLLAYVFRAEDDLLVNEAVAAAGEAEILSIPPNTAYDDRIATAVAGARDARAGLWGAC